jgi:hypothetical protein
MGTFHQGEVVVAHRISVVGIEDALAVGQSCNTF